MADKKIIAVVGATGAQGGGLVRAILADRSGAFTRARHHAQPGFDKAKALAALGRRGGRGAISDDAASLRRRSPAPTARSASPTSGSTSRRSARQRRPATMAEAAKAAGVQHAIWSTLEDTRQWVPLDDDRMPTLQGKYKVPHFDAKGEADQALPRRRRARPRSC